jgi:hypothetical protein
MKSNIQKVYSKLPKQELSAQKVELGLVEDLQKEYGKLQTLGLDADLMDFESKYEERIPKYNSLEIKFKDAAKKAEELGIDKLASEAKEFAGACQASVKKINKKVNLIKQVIKL